MLAAYSKHKRSIVGLKKTHLREVSRFGTVSGVWLKDKHEDKDSAKEHATNLVAQVLSDIGMSHYSDPFAKEKLLYDQLRTLTSEDLKEMDIPLGHRKTLLAHFS